MATMSKYKVYMAWSVFYVDDAGGVIGESAGSPKLRGK